MDYPKKSSYLFTISSLKNDVVTLLFKFKSTIRNLLWTEKPTTLPLFQKGTSLQP